MRRSLGLGVCLALSAILPAIAAEAPYGLATRPYVQGLTFPDQPPVSTEVKLEQIFPQFAFSQPVYIATAPGDDSQFYVVTLAGIIWRITNSATPTRTKLLDISAKTLTGGEQGLLGLAFDPGFASNKRFYIYYTPSVGEHRTQVSQFTAAATPQLTLASERELLRIPQPTATNHKGGCLQFGPDGKLYVAVGDGGAVPSNGQNLAVLLGKILRINPDGSVPSDNPFVGTPGARGEIWARGLRNPWRFSFDRTSGELWLGDVGQNRREEVDKIRRGGNYGWPIYEGDLAYQNPNNLPATSFDQPTFVYDHTAGTVVGKSITGGYIYRGSAIPSIAGKYVFADFVGGEVWGLTVSGAQLGTVRKLASVGVPTSLGTDNAGNLYVVSIGGQLYKIVPAVAGSTNFPTKLSQTGLFTDLVNLTPTQGLIEYEINAQFWSDGAAKRRWVGIANGGLIGFSSMNAWSLPFRSVLVKHFEITLSTGATKRLETRVLIHQSPGWRGYTYRWNSAGTDADLIDAAQSVVLTVMDPTSPTGSRTQTYEFPSRGACLSCHNTAVGVPLGFRALQFNRSHTFANGVADNQLRAWNHVGSFNYDIGDTKYYTAIVNPADTTKSVAARARSYLDANCAQCHRPGGPTSIAMDLRAFTSAAGTGAMNVAPTAGDMGIADARRIAPGSKERSVLWQRMRVLDGLRMPPIASHVVDQPGVNLIGAWIDAGAVDGYDFNTIRPMHGGSFTGSRNGLGNDTLVWNFAKAQSCRLTLTNAVNRTPKDLGTYPGSYTYARSGASLKNTYTLTCTNPYAVDVRSVVVQ